jgi:hypothetical protein
MIPTIPGREPIRKIPMMNARECAAHLEALVREADPYRKQAMWGRMIILLEISRPASWMAAASALRDRRVITDDLYCRLVEEFVLRYEPSDVELDRLKAEMLAFERAHGLADGEIFRAVDEPPEYSALSAACWRRHKELAVAWLRARGHDEVATLMESNDAEFQRRSDQGQAELWGPGGPPHR